MKLFKMQNEAGLHTWINPNDILSAQEWEFDRIEAPLNDSVMKRRVKFVEVIIRTNHGEYKVDRDSWDKMLETINGTKTH